MEALTSVGLKKISKIWFPKQNCTLNPMLLSEKFMLFRQTIQVAMKNSISWPSLEMALSADYKERMVRHSVDLCVDGGPWLGVAVAFFPPSGC